MDLKLLEELVVAGGEIGLRHFGCVERQLKADRTIVTQADVEVEELIAERIRTHFPRHSILGEETSASSIISSDYVWAIDPIDGTQGFSFGFPSWAVSVGLLQGGRPAYGAIFLPVVGDLYMAEPGAAYLNGRRLEQIPERPLDEHSYVMVPESIHHSYVYDWVGDILSFGAVATHCCYVARGSAVGSVCRPCIWDLAAGTAIMQEAGIVTRYADGSDINWMELFDGSRFRQATIAARPGHWDQVARSFKRRL
jgi:myo-inositol-1(or 4)-monophosphatase